MYIINTNISQKGKKINLFENLIFYISNEDWDFLCKNRFFTANPTEEEIQAEFVTGTGITKNKIHLWSEASSRFSEYVADLREIQKLNISHAARQILTDEEKYNEIT